MERNLVEVAFEATHNCNLRCGHCYNAHYLGRGKDMSTDQIIFLLNQLKVYGVQKLKLGGGEPLLRQDFFPIFRASQQLGLETNFSTNGLLVEENLCDILDSGVRKMQVSLDGIGEVHDRSRDHSGLYEIVKRGVGLLVKEGIKVNVATTLMRSNCDSLNALYEFCKGHGVYRWKIMKYIPRGVGDPQMLSPVEYREAVDLLMGLKSNDSPEVIVAREFDLIGVHKDYNDMQCFGGRSFMCIKPNGDVTPCSYIDDWVCGNVLSDFLDDIWNSHRMIDFSKGVFSGCDYFERCGGGCKAVSYRLGNLWGCDPYCWVDDTQSLVLLS